MTIDVDPNSETISMTDSSSNNSNNNHDQIIAAIGDWGKWQARYITVLGSLTVLAAWPVLIMAFMAAPTDFQCSDSKQPDETTSQDTSNSCSATTTTTNTTATTTTSCTSFAHDHSVFSNTIVQQWDLVCERTYLKNLAQSSFYFGMLVGGIPAGIFSDRCGRKPALITSLLGTAIVGSILPFSPNVESFIALRFLHGVVKMGYFMLVFVWSMEVVGGRAKTFTGIGLQLPWVVAWLALSLIGYYITDWRQIQWITALPGLLCVTLIFLLPESPKWLLTAGKLDEAETVIRDAAKLNGHSLPTTWSLVPLYRKRTSGQRNGNLLDLFSTKTLIIKTLVIYFNWFANSFVYYGLTLNSGNIGGSYRLNFFLNGLLEFPAYALCLYIIQAGGRKRPYIAFLVTGGVALLSTQLFSVGDFEGDWPILALAMVGKFCLTGSYAIIYVYSTELFPTVVRSVAVGSSSAFARIGGMVAPFVGSLDKVFSPTFPIAIFGLVSLIAASLVLLLPETRDRKMPDTLEEASGILATIATTNDVTTITRLHNRSFERTQHSSPMG